MPKIALAAAIFIFTAAPTLAFNKATHMISAAVAYHVLRAEAPQTLDKVIAAGGVLIRWRLSCAVNSLSY